MRLLTFLLFFVSLSGYAAGGSLNGYYKCEISSASYQRKQGAMRDFYFPDKQRESVVLFIMTALRCWIRNRPPIIPGTDTD